MEQIKIKLIEEGFTPSRKTEGAVAYDCYARVGTHDFIEIPSKSRCLVNLGFCLELPSDMEAVVRPRSGLSLKGIDVTVGTIDTDYRGEVKACVVNNTLDKFCIKKYDRICQIAFRKVPQVTFISEDKLSETERNCGGFGSTGV